ncbi:MAG: hypothetical protein AAGE94_24185, partial [Acidobacteriota bacterium]
LDVDQRGHLRPWDGPDLDTVARCDIGAVEVAAPGPGFFFGDGFEIGGTGNWASAVGETLRIAEIELRRDRSIGRGGGGLGSCLEPE